MKPLESNMTKGFVCHNIIENFNWRLITNNTKKMQQMYKVSLTANKIMAKVTNQFT